MKSKKISLNSEDFPEKLKRIAGSPQALFVLGAELPELLARPAVAIIGSRKVSPYGKIVTARLSAELAKAGIVIISGLAIGVDGIAHRAALEAGGLTIAVLPSSLERIYPTSHHHLAQQIVARGGALVSEYPAGSTMAYKANFIARNRIIAGLADAVLITEAAEKSGTLHTVNFALQQGVDVLAVPGNITSTTSAGANNLIRSGATIVTSVDDVFQVLGISPANPQKVTPKGSTPDEQVLIDLLLNDAHAGSALLEASKLDVPQFNQALTMLEIRGVIRPLGNNHWALK